MDTECMAATGDPDTMKASEKSEAILSGERMPETQPAKSKSRSKSSSRRSSRAKRTSSGLKSALYGGCNRIDIVERPMLAG